MKKIVGFGLVLLLTLGIYGCNTEKELTYEYGEREMMLKVWEDKTIYNETVVLVEENGIISGNLLFEPTKIISVRDYTLSKEYDPSEYEIDGRQIIRKESSTMPYLTLEQLSGKNLPDGYQLSTYQAKEPGTQIVFTEGIGLIMHQIAVTYTHEGTWTGQKPENQSNYLVNFKAKLEAKEDVTIVINGDSISTGANASSVLGIQPYQDDFPNLFKNQVASKFGINVNLVNTSVGGTVSQWGRENVDPNVNEYNPDLVVIGFGMNDGSMNVNPNTYKDNIEFMIRSIRARNESADIVLISTILANPVSMQDKIQKDYLPMLQELQDTYHVAILDMTSLSETLYTYKKGVDILANNINHPSDFLVRCYAAGLLEVIGVND